MKLLFVLPEYPPEYGGGIATYYGALLPALVEAGHEVTVVVGSAFVRGGRPYERDGVRVRFLSEMIGAAELRRFERLAAVPELQRHLAAAWGIWREMTESDFDLVEATDWGLLFVPWVVERGIPILVRLHGSCGQIARWDPAPGATLQEDLERLIEISVLRHAHGLATYSRANAREWETILGRAVCLGPPPVVAAPTPASVPSRDERGLAVGRLQHWKGPHVLCDALRIAGSSVAVEWAGRPVVHRVSGLSYDHYLSKAYPDIWGSRVVPLGLVSPAEIAERQRQASFVVVPSIWDMFNLTAAEAMAQGSILLCSEGAGAVDLIEPGVNGYSFPAGDAAALADLILQVRRLDESTRRRIGVCAWETVREKLRPDRVAAAAASQYEQLIAAPPIDALDSWSRQAVSPGTLVDPLRFLDGLPLASIVRYAAGRSAEKLKIFLGRYAPIS